MHRRSMLLTATAVAIALVVPPLPGSAGPGACAGDGAGGDWPMYGRDLAGTRHQDAPTAIGPDNVADLTLAWKVGSPLGAGRSTAVVWGRCVYIANDSNGTLSALDIETGAVVWSKRPIAPNFPLKTQTAAVAVVDGVVYANASEPDGSQAANAGVVAVARDAHTGALVYESRNIQFGKPTTAFASAIVHEGVQLVVTNGGDGVPDARPGFAMVDTRDGTVLADRTTIPMSDIEKGFAGGGQWATPVVDPATGYAFNGTANPYSKKKEHRYDNAIIKMDMNRARTDSTFGQVTDAYKGNVDQYFPGLDRQPLCDELGEEIGYHPCCNFSVTCVQLDIDFGGSPTSWTTTDGDLVVGALQKSGVFHAVYADTMGSAWSAVLSTPPPATAGNADSAANDGEKVYVVANPGVLFAMDKDTGRIAWAAPVGDLAEYHPVSVANGVVYVIGNHATLLSYDARDGRLLGVRSMPVDGRQFCFPLAGGIAIARDTVLANCDGTLFAYRLA